jgi:flagellar export protein FliJ
MKKFKFNLESVLKYRESVERYEKGILSELNAKLAEFVRELEKLNGDYKKASAEFEKMSGEGISVHDIRSNHAIMENIEFYIEKKAQEIEAQHRRITKQTAVVVKTMRESKTMGRLKEIKYEKYVKGENKEQEKFVEEYALRQLTNSN